VKLNASLDQWNLGSHIFDSDEACEQHKHGSNGSLISNLCEELDLPVSSSRFRKKLTSMIGSVRGNSHAGSADNSAGAADRSHFEMRSKQMPHSVLGMPDQVQLARVAE
jgi:hypothetical protein